MSENLHNRPILLVEDNPVDVDLTLRAFARRKLANPVEVARDGEEALAWIPRWEAGICRDLPIVILTSSNEHSDVQTAYRLRANSYIVKPVNFEKFMDVATQIELYWCLLNYPPK